MCNFVEGYYNIVSVGNHPKNIIIPFFIIILLIFSVWGASPRGEAAREAPLGWEAAAGRVWAWG